MYLYLKTPLWKNSKTVPHLVEHCAGKPFSTVDDFFTYQDWVQRLITTEYTFFELDNWLDRDLFLEKIFAPLSKEVYEYEKCVLKKECDFLDYDARIYEAMIQQFIDPNLSINSRKGKSWKDVQDYHSSYYSYDNLLICNQEVLLDQEYELLHQGKGFWLRTEFEKIFFSWSFVFEEDAYVILWNKSPDVENYWKLFFVFTLIGSYSRYLMRYQKGVYYYLMPYMDVFGSSSWVTLPQQDYSLLDKPFFSRGMQYISQMFKAGYFKDMLFLNNYFYWIPATREEVIAFSENFTWDTFSQEFLVPLFVHASK